MTLQGNMGYYKNVSTCIKKLLNIEVIAMDWLQMLNVVILFGSIAVALLNIAALLTKTSSFFKNRHN